MRKMPIGMQTFEDIIARGFAYVDKTAWVYELANEGKYFFLGRPRRFGKSLLVFTLRAYFEGKKELFKGLAAETLEKDWVSYPVIHIDFNVTGYRNVDDLESGLNTNLEQYEEVRYGFFYELLPVYTYRSPGYEEFFADYFVDDLRAGNVDGFMGRMRSFFANIPYELNDQTVNSKPAKAGEFSSGAFQPFAQYTNGDRRATERHYQLVFYIVVTLLGQYAKAEEHRARGRADMVVETAEAVYVFEFKLNGTAEEALKQINTKDYALSYEAGSRRIVKIGAEFDKETRNIERWLVEPPQEPDSP